MYKAYDMNMRQMIFASRNELGLLSPIRCNIEKYENPNVLIIKRENNMDEIYLRINSREMFEIYREKVEYEHIRDMSCPDLKREILDIKEKVKKRNE